MPTTWNPADLAGITLSNGNLTATSNTGGGAGVRAAAGLSSGKYYFEITSTTASLAYLGLALASASLTTGSTAGGVGVNMPGAIYVNGSAIGSSIPGRSAGAILCIAVDLSNTLIWFRTGAAGSWNALSGTANDPATGTGGVNYRTAGGILPAGALYPWFSSAFTNGQVMTANFGASGFSGVVPAGFTAGFGPVAASAQARVMVMA